MNYKQKRKAAILRKRQKKIEREVILMAMGAGMYWLEDGYFEFQNDYGICLPLLMNAVIDRYEVDRKSYIFDFNNLDGWDTPKKIAAMIDQEIINEKRLAKEKAAEEANP